MSKSKTKKVSATFMHIYPWRARPRQVESPIVRQLRHESRSTTPTALGCSLDRSNPRIRQPTFKRKQNSTAMCIQKTQYSCGHRILRQLPCPKVSQKRSCFSSKPSKPACRRLYDWDLDEPSPRCEREEREAQVLRSRGYPSPLPTPQRPRGFQQAPPPPVQATRAPRPDSYYDPALNAELTALPGHYQVVSTRLTVPSPPRPARLRPERIRTQYDRSRMPSSPAPTPSHRHRGPAPMPLSVVTSPYHGRYALGDDPKSPVSSGEADSRLVSPMSSVGGQSWQQTSRAR